MALLELFGAAGVGADVSTLGELVFALRAGIPGERLIVHGNNKSDEELRAAAEAGALYVVLDALDEIPRAAAAEVRRVLVRVTPGIEADTHVAIPRATTARSSGSRPTKCSRRSRKPGPRASRSRGSHVHIGSQLLETQAARTSVDWLAGFAADCRAELDWTPDVVDLGGGLGIQYVAHEAPPAIEDFVSALLGRARARVAPP